MVSSVCGRAVNLCLAGASVLTSHAFIPTTNQFPHAHARCAASSRTRVCMAGGFGRARGLDALTNRLNSGSAEEQAIQAKISVAPEGSHDAFSDQDDEAYADLHDVSSAATPAAPQKSKGFSTMLKQSAAAASAPQVSDRTLGLITFAVYALLAAGVFIGGKSLFARQETLVDAYAVDMVQFMGDTEKLDGIHKKYTRKIGPFVYRPEMFAAFMLELSRDRPVTVQTLLTVDHFRRKFGFSEPKMNKIMSEAVKSTSLRNPGALAKLFFYGEKLGSASKNPEAAAKGLEPIRTQLLKRYKASSAEIVRSAQKALTEQALRDSIQPGMTELPAGYKLLKLSEERAEEIFQEALRSAARRAEGGEDEDDDDDFEDYEDDTIVTKPDVKRDIIAPTGSSAPMSEAQKAFEARVSAARQRDADDAAAAEAKRLERASIYERISEESASEDAELVKQAATGNKAQECSSCGYTMYIAPGREFKFFADDFKCPNCGADRSKFNEKFSDPAAAETDDLLS